MYHRRPGTRPPVLPLLAVVAMTLAACSSSRPFSQRMYDVGVTCRVKAKLAADPEVNPFKIDVDTREQVVYLQGVVKREEQRQEAEKLAAGTSGVVRVVNELRVGRRSFGSGLSDTWIVTKVKAKLAADRHINPFVIDVDAHQGEVTLKGRVRNDWQREKAEFVASRTAGVTAVRNHIQVSVEGG